MITSPFSSHDHKPFLKPWLQVLSQAMITSPLRPWLQVLSQAMITNPLKPWSQALSGHDYKFSLKPWSQTLSSHDHKPFLKPWSQALSQAMITSSLSSHDHKPFLYSTGNFSLVNCCAVSPSHMVCGNHIPVLQVDCHIYEITSVTIHSVYIYLVESHAMIWSAHAEHAKMATQPVSL